MSPNRTDGLLARVDFPLYTLQTLTNRHVLVAGGGGASKTGVANGFEIFELSHNGSRFVAEEVMRHETGSNVVMNCSVRSIQNRMYLTAGQESHCQLYRVNIRMVDTAEMRRGSFKAENGLIRRRRRTVSENDNISKTDRNSNSTEKRISFEIRPSESVQTDFGDEAMQRVVRISNDGKLMATGGTDGRVRVWSFPKMQLLHEIEAHTKEIDDLDFSPCDTLLVSIAKDGGGAIWPARPTGPARSGGPTRPADRPAPKMRLQPAPPNGTKYLFKRCRFGLIEDSSKPKDYRLFTLANPLGRSGKQKGLLQLWESDGSLKKTVCIEESLSALAVRDDGRFVGVGTMFSGSVHIYVAFSLQRVLAVQGAHNMFVTGLEFVGARGGGPPVTSRSEAALLSISVDNRLCVHSLPYPSTMPAWVAIALIVFVLFCTFTLCSYLGI